MNINELNKKELKDFIKENGFFFHMQCNKLDKNELNLLQTNNTVYKETGKQIPEWDNILVFSWIASQWFKKWEKSRNWYKYDQDGWEFTEYFKNPLILWQHDNQYWGIGHSVKFWKDSEWNLNILFYVDLDTLDDKSKVQVERWYVTAVSTWAISIEEKFEDVSSGNLLTIDEAEEKYSFDEIWYAYMGMSDKLILVVTKAKMIENSMVTIWSNEWAIVWITDWLENRFKIVADKYKTSHNLKINEIKQDQEKNEEIEEKVAETEIQPNNTPKDIIPENEEKLQDSFKNKNDNQNLIDINILDWKMSDMIKKVDDFEKQINDKFENINNIFESIKTDYVSNETLTNKIEDLKNNLEKTFNDSIETFKKENEDTIKSLQEDDILIADAFSDLVNKLKNTVFDGIKQELKQEDKPKTKLYNQLASIK